jgi:hypothetical protein
MTLHKTLATSCRIHFGHLSIFISIGALVVWTAAAASEFRVAKYILFSEDLSIQVISGVHCCVWLGQGGIRDAREGGGSTLIIPASLPPPPRMSIDH